MRRARSDFESCVVDAIAAIPEHLRVRFRNVAITIADAPTAAQRAAFDCTSEETMYGCYEGTPLTERDGDGEPLLPDRIVLFRRPLEADFGDDANRLRREIALTILHEFAHHVGITDEQLERLEQQWVDRGVVR
ncbi:metallopeptidase family protein [Candidatus Uhrbacteria bacterium]|nr:metallopeptidase family protein [Candidatus Uhrbacteria bacterium]